MVNDIRLHIYTRYSIYSVNPGWIDKRTTVAIRVPDLFTHIYIWIYIYWAQTQKKEIHFTHPAGQMSTYDKYKSFANVFIVETRLYVQLQLPLRGEHLLPSSQWSWRIGNRFRVIYLPTIDTRFRRAVICILMSAAGIGTSLTRTARDPRDCKDHDHLHRSRSYALSNS